MESKAKLFIKKYILYRFRIKMTEQVNFKEFLKRNPDYIRIYKDNESDIWRLYGSVDTDVKVFGETRKENVIFEVNPDEIEIHLSVSKGWDDKKEYADPSQLNFHHRDTETLKTLLAHKPTKLYLDYWYNNLSDNGKKIGATCETITIEGRKFNKNSKLLKSFKVAFTTPNYFGTIRSRY